MPYVNCTSYNLSLHVYRPIFRLINSAFASEIGVFPAIQRVNVRRFTPMRFAASTCENPLRFKIVRNCPGVIAARRGFAGILFMIFLGIFRKRGRIL